MGKPVEKGGMKPLIKYSLQMARESVGEGLSPRHLGKTGETWVRKNSKGRSIRKGWESVNKKMFSGEESKKRKGN